MKVLVTGGAGFIGSNFVIRARQVRPDWRMTVLDAMTYAANLTSLDPVRGDIDVVKGSVCDAPLVDELVAAHDVVVHFAADSHNDNSLDDPWPFVDTNIVGTYQLVQAVRRHGKRLHHISTDEVYGDLELDDPARFTEATPVQPLEPLLGLEGERRPPRPRLGPLLRAPGDDLELLEQLRPAPAPGEVHPPPDHRHPRRGPAQAVRRRGQRPRLDPRR